MRMFKVDEERYINLDQVKQIYIEYTGVSYLVVAAFGQTMLGELEVPENKVILKEINARHGDSVSQRREIRKIAKEKAELFLETFIKDNMS